MKLQNRNNNGGDYYNAAPSNPEEGASFSQSHQYPSNSPRANANANRRSYKNFRPQLRVQHQIKQDQLIAQYVRQSSINKVIKSAIVSNETSPTRT